MIIIDSGYRPIAPTPLSAPPTANLEQAPPVVTLERRRGGDRRDRQANRGMFEMRSGHERRRGYPGGQRLDIEV